MKNENLFDNFILENIQYDINKMIPPLMQNSIESKYHDALNIELEKIRLAVIETFKQLFVLHATWGLEEWEKLACISTPSELDNDIKRANIIAAFKSLGVTNAKKIIAICSSYQHGDVTVHEYPSDFKYVIEFLDTIGVPSNISEIEKRINLINPAHLTFDFKFKYITWGDIKEAGLSADFYKNKGYTWEDIRNGKN